VLAEPPAFWIIPAEERRTDERMRAMDELLSQLGVASEPTDEHLSKFLILLGRSESQPERTNLQAWQQWVAKREALRGLKAVANHTDDPKRLSGFHRPVLVVTGKDTVAFHRRINDLLATALPSVVRVDLPGGHRAAITAKDDFLIKLNQFYLRHPPGTITK
jgi:hypothetical protein